MKNRCRRRTAFALFYSIPLLGCCSYRGTGAAIPTALAPNGLDPMRGENQQGERKNRRPGKRVARTGAPTYSLIPMCLEESTYNHRGLHRGFAAGSHGPYQNTHLGESDRKGAGPGRHRLAGPARSVSHSVSIWRVRRVERTPVNAATKPLPRHLRVGSVASV